MSLKVTGSGLRTIAPGAADTVVLGIVSFQYLFQQYGIDTNRRLRHFLAQAACETAGFTRLEENLFYTTVSRLRAVWPSRFPSDVSARPYLRNPRGLANKVYGGRLGNVAPNDGWDYRGSGVFCTTGKANFARVEAETGIRCVTQPALLRKFGEALEAACIYWRDHDLNRFADADDIAGLTRAVQGGSGGLADRRIYLDRARRVDFETGEAPAAAPKPTDARPILRRGKKGPVVEQAQRLLAAHGYDIKIDGDFGPGTDNIVREFQESRGLMADGVIGPTTWAALRAKPGTEPQQQTLAGSPAVTQPASQAGGGRGFVAALLALLELVFRRRQ